MSEIERDGCDCPDVPSTTREDLGLQPLGPCAVLRLVAEEIGRGIAEGYAAGMRK